MHKFSLKTVFFCIIIDLIEPELQMFFPVCSGGKHGRTNLFFQEVSYEKAYSNSKRGGQVITHQP